MSAGYRNMTTEQLLNAVTNDGNYWAKAEYEERRRLEGQRESVITLLQMTVSLLIILVIIGAADIIIRTAPIVGLLAVHQP
jgi:hypothetical protein